MPRQRELKSDQPPATLPARAQKKFRPRPGPHTPLKVDWAPAYIAALADTGMVTRAAEAAGVHHTTVLRRRRSDPEFAAQETESVASATQVYEAEAVRRAMVGTKRTKYGRDGKILCVEVEYSDAILLRLLERHLPSWRSKQSVEMTNVVTHATRAERKAALEKARAFRDCVPGGQP